MGFRMILYMNNLFFVFSSNYLLFYFGLFDGDLKSKDEDFWWAEMGTGVSRDFGGVELCGLNGNSIGNGVEKEIRVEMIKEALDDRQV